MRTPMHAHAKRPEAGGGPIVLSTVDYARLEPMIRDAVASGTVARDLLRALKLKIDEAQILEPSDMPGDVVTMNSLVHVRDIDAHEVEVYTLVYPGFADVAQGRLSILTPIGAAILGVRRGETIECAAVPVRHLLVEKVEFQPESAGQYDV